MPLDTSTLLNRRRIRRTFGKISEAVTMPNLIEVQRHSYDQYLQMFVKPDDRLQEGLQEVFTSIFPIKDFSGRSMLEFVSYNLENPKYDVEECQQRGLTYAAGLRVTLRLVVWDLDEDSGAKSVRDMKEQDVLSQMEYPIDVMLLIHKAFSADAADVEQYIGDFDEEHSMQSFTLSFNEWAVAMMYHADMEDAHMTVDMEIDYARDNENEHTDIHTALEGVESLINLNENKDLEYRVKEAILSLSDALHVEVINKLQDVMDVLDEEIGQQALIPRTKRHLFEKVVNARVTQDDHFENEEAFILPIIREHWSEEEQLALVKILFYL